MRFLRHYGHLFSNKKGETIADFAFRVFKGTASYRRPALPEPLQTHGLAVPFYCYGTRGSR